MVLHKQPTTSSPNLFSLKSIHLIIKKIKNSGVLTAPPSLLKLVNSGDADVTTDAAGASNKVNFKNLEH